MSPKSTCLPKRDGEGEPLPKVVLPKVVLPKVLPKRLPKVVLPKVVLPKVLSFPRNCYLYPISNKYE